MGNDAIIRKLGEVAEIRMGYPFRGAIPEVPGGSVRIIQIRDVTRVGLNNCDDLLTTEVEGRKEPDWVLDQDVLFVARGAHAYSALVTRPPARTVCSQHIYVIRVKAPDRLLPAFVAWQLNQVPAQRYLRQSAEGSHQLSIRRAVLEMTEIRIPPIELQSAMVNLMRAANAEHDTFQALIKNRETELAILAARLLT
ncbi:MAG TPA: restriction endonuclease subunit S [Dokdonella sp.]|uniref:restriction endonuclease subunit S n=1 Tax=Dokdonella sp. TaxID=2291710 RepID=UPI002D7E9025|nr:restriction endonuclease subunit S [Dokdonella sp.]HET9033881.1 restriction endonuclease subunit S [Dokdonella sp.]